MNLELNELESILNDLGYNVVVNRQMENGIKQWNRHNIHDRRDGEFVGTIDIDCNTYEVDLDVDDEVIEQINHYLETKNM